LVSITLLAGEGERVADWHVFFQDRDSSLVLSTRTDGAGHANAYMNAGGSVTLVETRGNSKFIYTYSGVKPGDDLTVDRRPAPSDSVEIEVMIAPASGAISYQLYDSCGSGGANDVSGAVLIPVRIALFGCADTANLLVVALFPGGGRSYLYRGEVQLHPLGLISFDGPYHPVESSLVVVTEAPPAIERVFVSQELARIRLPQTSASIALLAGAGSAMIQLPQPADTVTATRVDLDDGASIGVQRVTSWGPSSSTTALELGGGLRPYTARPWFDRPSQSVRWGEAPSGIASDLVFVGVAWARFSTSVNYQWILVGPRAPETVMPFPILPEPDLNPSSDDAPNPFTLVNLSVDGGYDRVRPRFLGPWSAGAPWPIDGPTGRVLYQELGIGT